MPREIPPSAYFFLYGLEAGAGAAANDEASLSARTITVHGVGDKNAGAHDAEECSNCFEHNNDPNAQRPDLTARGPAQSKGFRWGSNFCRGNDDFVQQAMPWRDELRTSTQVGASGPSGKSGKILT
jgi:cytochrome c2